MSKFKMRPGQVEFGIYDCRKGYCIYTNTNMLDVLEEYNKVIDARLAGDNSDRFLISVYIRGKDMLARWIADLNVWNFDHKMYRDKVKEAFNAQSLYK